MAACLLALYCGQRDYGMPDLPMPPTTTGRAGLHAVRNEQLREAMSGLRGVSFDRLPQELDDPGGQRARLQEASLLAEGLAQTAGRIADIAGEVGLSEDEQQVFLNLAEQLRSRALQLGGQAERRQTRLIGGTMNEIEDTCAACHTLFRDLPQPSGPGAL